MASAEEDFPRGGPAKKTSEKHLKAARTPKPRVEVDNLFETREPVVKKKKKVRSKHEDERASKRQKTEGDLKLNKANSVEILHMKNLKVGTVMLGCVRELLNFEVVLGLPNGLKGYMPVSNISEAYTKILSRALDSGTDLEEFVSPSHLLTLGQLVRCVVSSLDLSKEGFVSLKLSINPKDVNKELHSSSLKAGMTLSGCVESVEDHGYLIDIGVSGTKAFLPKEKASDKTKTTIQDLIVGQYMVVLLEEVKNEGRVVRLSINPTAVNQACAETQHGWTLSNLLPGLLVRTHIKKVTAHGLIVTFLSSYTGMVDFMHVDPDKLSTYNVGDEVKARILYVDPSSRLVGLSLRSHLLPPGGIILDNVISEQIGEVLSGCQMTSVHHHSGAVMELPDGTTAFVHKSHLKQSKEEFNPNRLLAQPEHTLRIIDYCPIEQIHLATLRKAIVESAFYSYQDVKAGQMIEGKVQSLEKYGLIIKISDHIKGLVPRIHLADIILNNPEKKYKEGMRLKCKVLSVDYQNKKITMSRKKALMETKLPLILSYADARVGLVSHGFIVCIKDFGCIVKFYGEVKGLVPMSELTSEPFDNPQSLFYIGQVVKAKVLKCDIENEKLLLSFKAVSQRDIEKVQHVKFDFKIGKKVEVIVRSKCQTAVEVSILPEETPALLPTVHLSDHVSNCPLLLAGLQEGDTISNVVCLNQNKESIILSKKPLLIAALAAENLVTSFSELQVGMVMVGWVKNIMSYGIFISFPHGLFGLAPKAAMTDKFITGTAGVFEVGQTVLAKVTNLDEEKQRFLISLKVSDVNPAETSAQARMIEGQRERLAVCDAMSTRVDSDLLQQLSSVSLGDKLKMTVDVTREDGSVVLTSDQLSHATVLASRDHVTDVNTTPGNQVTAVVLHVDFLTSEVHVSLLLTLTVKRKKLTKDSQYPATVQYVDKDFAVISLGTTGHLTVISISNHLNETSHIESEKLSVGRSITVTVSDPSSEDLGGRALVDYQFARVKRSQSKSKNKVEDNKYKIGASVTATVKTVKPLCVLVSLPDGVTGSLHVSQVQDSPQIGGFPTSSLKVGTEVKARVIGGREIKSHRFLPITHPNLVFSLPELTLLPSKLDDDVTVASLINTFKWENYHPEQEITCYVSKYISKTNCLQVEVSPKVFGFVELLAMTTKPEEATHPQKLFKHGQCVSAKVVKVIPKKPYHLRLSLIGAHTLEKGVVTMGMVWKINPQKGLFLNLPFGNSGTVCITDLSDEYVDAPFEQYKEGQMVRCCVIGEENGKFQLSLRLSRIPSGKLLQVKDVDISSVSELQEGQIIQGYVKNVGEMGIFIRLSRSVTGRVKFQHATNYFAIDYELFPKHILQNALLTTKVLCIDAKTGHVELSLLPEDTGKADILPESLGLPLRLKGKAKEKHDKKSATRKRKMSESQQNDVGQQKKLKKEEKAAEDKKKGEKFSKAKEPQAEDQDSGVEVYFREKDNNKTKKKGKSEALGEPGRLQVASDFSWDVALSSLKPATSAQNAYESSDDEQDDQSKTQKKSRREAELERKDAEQKLSKLETELMEPSARPESAEAFERLLLSSPDSSLLWLQYMAFQLQATQIEQARTVAERALKTISFREEQEKLNVWVALLNLENMYGTEESLQKVFDRAVQYCEPMPVYQQLADIYANSDKIKEAENLYKNMLKRFRQEKAVWQSYGSFLLRQGQSDAANALLQRALQSLSNKEHVDLIIRFARMEFQYGNEERAKAMFEKVLSSYPKRTDLWSVFIDLMMKHGSQKDVRALFDRVVHLSVSVKIVKFFFKRYLDYEKKHGTPESIQAVKQKALEYVESKGADAAI